jgi:hypothetical protein
MIEISAATTIEKKIINERLRFNESNKVILNTNASCQAFRKSMAGTSIIKLSFTNVIKSKKIVNHTWFCNSFFLAESDFARKYKDTLTKSIQSVSLMQFLQKTTPWLPTKMNRGNKNESSSPHF